MAAPRSIRTLRVFDLAVALAVAALYVAFAKLGLALAFRAAQVTVVWPPTGFALAAMLRLGWRSTPGIFLGALIANATAEEPLWVAGGIAIGNTLEAVVGATLLRSAGFDGRLMRVRDVIALLAAVVASPLVSATIGVSSLGAGGVQPVSSLPGLWWLWWLGDALGGLVVTPLLLVWTDRDPIFRRPDAAAEALVLLAGLIGACAVVFLRSPQIQAIEYVIFPFLIWAALRFGPAGAATAAVLTNAIAVWGTQDGRGPFAGAGPEQGLVLLQVFMAVAATTGLFLGAITAQKEQAAKAMAEADRRKDEFLAMLGHELRNPLAPILHAADLLGSPEQDVVKRAREIIRRQSEHMARLVDDLLDVSRITRGAVKLERRLVSLDQLVSTAVETWRHLITQRQQHLSIDIPAEPMWLDVDPTRVAQIIANLVHNASKFTPVGGRIAIIAVRENGSLLMHIRDNGQGMSPELVAHAFELFVQGPAPPDRHHGGLGLGLTLVRRLIELHDGTVEARSEGMGQGSEFSLRVPLAEAPGEFLASVPPPPEAKPAVARPLRILVIEDNADARDMLRYLLKRAGHDVRTAGDGPSGIAEADRFAPEVVLLDIGLPGMNGYDVARALRQLPRCSGAVIVAVTGYGQPEDQAKSQAAGIDHHLLKPVDRATLLELMRKVAEH